jgi:hypothetical protein
MKINGYPIMKRKRCSSLYLMLAGLILVLLGLILTLMIMP